MALIPRETLDAVRERIDLVEVVQRHVKLSRRGASWVGLCPFHQEKTPSFNVVPSKSIYHCFGCNEGGDVFKFVMRLEGLTFFEAVKELADGVGIEIETRELSAAEKRAMRRRATLYDVLEEAAAYYESQLWTSQAGKAGRDYLEERAITTETARAARLGWAPGGWTTLVDHLHQRGFDAKLAMDAGLAKEGRGVYDTFRERLLFAIRDDRGRVIGFGGRALGDDGPKYINSPETRLYQKSSVLYGLQAARNGIQRADRVLVVEGYFDVLSLHQAGFTETVANCGTALTDQHIERIRRMTRNLVLLLDADEAGSRAAERALPLTIAAGLDAWRLQLPDAKDPDELIRNEGPEAMARALEQREPLVEWVIQRKLTAHAGSTGQIGILSRERVVEDLLPILKRLPDALISPVAARIGVHEASLRKRLANASPASAPAPAAPLPSDGWRPERDMVHLLWLLVHRRDQVADILRAMQPRLLEPYPIQVRQLLARLMSGEQEAAILDDLTDTGVVRTLHAVMAREALYDEGDAAMGCCEILAKMAEPALNRALSASSQALQRAHQDGDRQAVRDVAAKKQALEAYSIAIQTAIRAREPGQVAALLAAPPDL